MFLNPSQIKKTYFNRKPYVKRTYPRIFITLFYAILLIKRQRNAASKYVIYHMVSRVHWPNHPASIWQKDKSG